MPVVRQKRIVRAELQANPHVLYLFGDNDQRDGYGGQAAEMRDEETGEPGASQLAAQSAHAAEVVHRLSFITSVGNDELGGGAVSGWAVNRAHRWRWHWHRPPPSHHDPHRRQISPQRHPLPLLRNRENVTE